MSSTNADDLSGTNRIELEPFKLPKPGDYHKTITMATIARATGVSQGAISSLLNDRDYGIRVSDKTRERVFKVCREMGYIPNDLRAVVRMYPEMGDICILASSDLGSPVANPFCSRVISAAMAAMPAGSNHIILSPFEAGLDYTANPDQLPKPVQTGTASKFLMVGTPNPSLCQAIVSHGFPVSVIGLEVALPGVTSFLPDYEEASRMAVAYLFSLGHTRVAIFSGPFGTTDYAVVELNRGVRAGYEKIDVPIEAQNIIHGELNFQNGYNAAETLLKRQPRPTAFFCLNDISAAGVVARLHKSGLKIPGEISVLGCSGDILSDYVSPALTTVHLPVEEMAVEGIREAFRRIKDPDNGLAEAKKIVLPVRLIERESCAAQKA